MFASVCFRKWSDQFKTKREPTRRARREFTRKIENQSRAARLSMYALSSGFAAINALIVEVRRPQRCFVQTTKSTRNRFSLNKGETCLKLPLLFLVSCFLNVSNRITFMCTHYRPAAVQCSFFLHFVGKKLRCIVLDDLYFLGNCVIHDDSRHLTGFHLRPLCRVY